MKSELTQEQNDILKSIADRLPTEGKLNYLRYPDKYSGGIVCELRYSHENKKQMDRMYIVWDNDLRTGLDYLYRIQVTKSNGSNPRKFDVLVDVFYPKTDTELNSGIDAFVQVTNE